MPFQAFAAPSSRIKKSKKPPPLFKRNTSFTNLPRRKAPPPKEKCAKEENEEERLQDIGLVNSLTTDLTLHSIPQTIQYTRATMFSPIPETSTGMNSTRIAEILNYRKNLPPIVSVAHIQALLNSPTSTEREIAELIRKGVLRKIVLPGRGAVGEICVLVRDLEGMVMEEKGMGIEGKEEFIRVLRENPIAMMISKDKIDSELAKCAMQAGFLTSPTTAWSITDIFTQPTDTSIPSISSISKAPSGSLAAIGGPNILTPIHGYSSKPPSSSSQPTTFTQPSSYTLAIPSTGPYLKLIISSRQHLLHLIRKFSPKYKEMTEDLLREKWDGEGLLGGRNEFEGVKPGKTLKWKRFWGVRFEWVLAECVGVGLVEVFEMGAVGRGVRVLG